MHTLYKACHRVLCVAIIIHFWVIELVFSWRCSCLFDISRQCECKWCVHFDGHATHRDQLARSRIERFSSVATFRDPPSHEQITVTGNFACKALIISRKQWGSTIADSETTNCTPAVRHYRSVREKMCRHPVAKLIDLCNQPRSASANNIERGSISSLSDGATTVALSWKCRFMLLL